MAGVDYVIHAAAIKIIPLAEYDPVECAATNIVGTVNVAEAAVDAGVKKAILISTDKASAPSTLYGASKLCAERIWLAANRYCPTEQKFCAVRYGNVFGSAGSVIHTFLRQKESGTLLLTDRRMTRFHLTISDALKIIYSAVGYLQPGQLYVPKLPSYSLENLARALGEDLRLEYTGRRPGEKLSESLISRDESCYAVEHLGRYILTPGIVQTGSEWDYTSSSNTVRLSVADLREVIRVWQRNEPSLSPSAARVGALATTLPRMAIASSGQ